MSPQSSPPWADAAADSALAARIVAFRTRIERVLDRELIVEEPPTSRLCEAMRYSVLGGGKRLRALLVYLTGEAFGLSLARLDAAAAAVEMIHAYSLIHDDLPAMDDDDLRRGRPACHRAFDEGTAILAGDALQALAFALLAQPQAIPGGDLSAEQRVLMLALLARAIGTEGMAGGQAIDLEAVGRDFNAHAIERMHRRKTGALIQASVELGAIAAGLWHQPAYPALGTYGAEIGLAFQIQDDILDVTGETDVLGKTRGADAALGKPTYPSVLGLATARALAIQHRDRAVAALQGLGAAVEPLRQLAHYVVDRAL
ncbi:MAG TPA: farnesyl diphosphate synthase [Steroidobacteraceae bacterium]|jgi:geranylgeranyl pyrophosphate synthase